MTNWALPSEIGDFFSREVAPVFKASMFERSQEYDIQAVSGRDHYSGVRPPKMWCLPTSRIIRNKLHLRWGLFIYRLSNEVRRHHILIRLWRLEEVKGGFKEFLWELLVFLLQADSFVIKFRESSATSPACCLQNTVYMNIIVLHSWGGCSPSAMWFKRFFVYTSLF